MKQYARRYAISALCGLLLTIFNIVIRQFAELGRWEQVSLWLAFFTFSCFLFFTFEALRAERLSFLERGTAKLLHGLPYRKWQKGLLIGGLLASASGFLVSVLQVVAFSFISKFLHEEDIEIYSLLSGGLLVLLALLAGTFRFAILRAGTEALYTDHCPICGYDLHGLECGRCPECSCNFQAE